jgi:ElaB/YqjD/DUF883 family membrane-anchored ribosome-binding protein
MKNNQDFNPSAEFLADLKALVAEAEAMAAQADAPHSAELLDSMRARFVAVQEQFSEAYAGARKKVVAGAKYTDATIRANPYQALAIAAGVGVLIGVLVGRRSK